MKDTYKKTKTFTVCLGVFFILLIVGQYSIDPYKLNVDRWSAINNFLYNLFHGIFPYSAKTHLGNYGDPFPIWMIIHIPFYFFQNVGLSFFVAYIAFCYSLFKYKGYNLALTTGVLLLFSPAIIYEVMVRSDLITNILVTGTIINLMIAYNKTLDKNYFLISFVVSLILSSRLCVAIPLYIWLLKEFFYVGIRKQFIISFSIIALFVVPFIPFAIGNGHLLFLIQDNPFGMQTMLGSWQEAVLLIIVFTCLALSWKDYMSMNSNIAFAMLFLVMCTFTIRMWQNNEWTHLFQTGYDITYFNMSLPFICVVISIPQSKALT